MFSAAIPTRMNSERGRKFLQRSGGRSWARAQCGIRAGSRPVQYQRIPVRGLMSHETFIKT